MVITHALCQGDQYRRGCEAGVDGAPRPVVIMVGGQGFCGFHSPVDVPSPSRTSSKAAQVREGLGRNDLDALEVELGVRALFGRSALGGVSLAKATDRDIPGVVVYFVSEWALDGIRAERGADVDSALSAGVLRGVDRNEPMALARAFGVLASR